MTDPTASAASTGNKEEKSVEGQTDGRLRMFAAQDIGRSIEDMALEKNRERSERHERSES